MHTEQGNIPGIFGDAQYIMATKEAPEYAACDPLPLFRREFTLRLHQVRESLRQGLSPEILRQNTGISLSPRFRLRTETRLCFTNRKEITNETNRKFYH